MQDEREFIINFMNDHKEATEYDIKNTQADIENHDNTMATGNRYDRLLDELVTDKSQKKEEF